MQADKMQIECWKSEKITLNAVREAANPFLDVDITAVLQARTVKKSHSPVIGTEARPSVSVLCPQQWDSGNMKFTRILTIRD